MNHTDTYYNQYLNQHSVNVLSTQKLDLNSDIFCHQPLQSCYTPYICKFNQRNAMYYNQNNNTVNNLDSINMSNPIKISRNINIFNEKPFQQLASQDLSQLNPNNYPISVVDVNSNQIFLPYEYQKISNINNEILLPKDNNQYLMIPGHINDYRNSRLLSNIKSINNKQIPMKTKVVGNDINNNIDIKKHLKFTNPILIGNINNLNNNGNSFVPINELSKLSTISNKVPIPGCMAYSSPLMPMIPNVTVNNKNQLKILFEDEYMKNNNLNNFIKNEKIQRKIKIISAASPMWTPEEDRLLKILRKEKKLSWRDVSIYFPSRTINACQFRWKRLTDKEKNKLKRGLIKLDKLKTMDQK